jgi:phage shock protein C
MLASGRITEEEAAELRDALSDQHPGSGGSLSERRLMKSRHPLLLGVCGGLADWLGWDPAIVRVLYVVATLMVVWFPGVLLYLVLALVMPPHPEAEGASGRAAAVIVVVVFLFLLMLLLLYGLLGMRMTRRTRMHSHCPAAVRELRIDWPYQNRR